MSSGSNSDKRSLGEKLRDIINPALDDERRPKIQADLLNAYFEQVAENFSALMERTYTDLFNKVVDKKRSKNGETVLLEPEERNPIVINQLTEMEKTMMGWKVKYSPTLRLEIHVCTAFTTFSAAEIKELPAYIRLHEEARRHDVALRVVGLTADESKTPSGYTLPGMLIIDGSKSYVQGAMENSNMYPDLPPPKADFDRGQAQDFKL